MSTTNIGDTIRLTVKFKDMAGVAGDPASVSFLMIDPLGIVTNWVVASGQVVKDAVGVYHADWPVATAGQYTYVWTGTGGPFAATERGGFEGTDPRLVFSDLRNGPCAPWTDGTEVASLPWVAKAMAAAVAGNLVDTAGAATICADSAQAASEVLYELSGRVFTGLCGPVTVRPLSRPVDIDARAFSQRFGWVSSWGGCSYDWGNQGVASHFGCSNPPEIDLGVYPVNQIVQVKIDGTVIPLTEYELRDHKTLVRMRTTASAQPTARWGWPTCQTMDLPDTEQGTFSVKYVYGQPPPTMGVIAARKLAEYFALPQFGDNTKYPQRVTSIQRQGVSSMVVDVMDIVKTGATGIYEVDVFLRSANPNQQARQASVWSPDMSRARRTAT